MNILLMWKNGQNGNPVIQEVYSHMYYEFLPMGSCSVVTGLLAVMESWW